MLKLAEKKQAALEVMASPIEGRTPGPSLIAPSRSPRSKPRRRSRPWSSTWRRSASSRPSASAAAPSPCSSTPSTRARRRAPPLPSRDRRRLRRRRSLLRHQQADGGLRHHRPRGAQRADRHDRRPLGRRQGRPGLRRHQLAAARPLGHPGDQLLHHAPGRRSTPRARSSTSRCAWSRPRSFPR